MSGQEREDLERELEELRRERSIDAALSVLRDAIGGLRSSDGLMDLVEVTGGEVAKFVQGVVQFGINTFDAESETLSCRVLILGKRLRFEQTEPDFQVEQWTRRWQRQATWCRKITLPADAQRRYLDQGVDPDVLSLVVRDGGVLVDAYFEHGSLVMGRLGDELFTPEEADLLERFAAVFELGYRRLIDLQSLEEQAERLQRERAVERVRAEAMAMRKSDDIATVVAALWEEMCGLGIETPHATINYALDETGLPCLPGWGRVTTDPLAPLWTLIASSRSVQMSPCTGRACPARGETCFGIASCRLDA